MNNVDRHHYIITQLKERGSLNVIDLCQKLSVSSVTIRKDLKLLEERQLLFRTHGGATLKNPYAVDRSVFEKEKMQYDQKMAIARTAADLIEENDSIIIASGTTVLAMARNIQPRGNLMVVTSALNVAVELLRHPQVEILQLGGQIRNTSVSVAGAYAEQALDDFYCSKLFLGVDGIDPVSGLTTTSASEAKLNRKMINAVQKTIVLADSTKFGRRGFGKICLLEDVDEVITDKNIPSHVRNDIEGMGVKITIAE